MADPKKEKRQRDINAVASNPENYAALTEAMHGAQRTPGFLVALGTQRDLPSERKIAAFAAAIEIDEFTARQWLLAPSPRILRREDNEPAAVEWAEWLGALGLRAYEIPESQFAAQEFLPVLSLSVDKAAVHLQIEGGEERTVPLGKLLCLVAGEVREQTLNERTAEGMLSATFTSDKGDKRAEHLLDIHFRDGDSYRVSQDTFRWSSLFPTETGQSLVLFRRLIDLFQKSAPGLRVYDDFDKAGAILGQSRQLLHASSFLSVNWMRKTKRLLYERHRTIRESDQEAFDLYSTLLRWQKLKS
ncbi:hypothetical protein BH09SUM1_BH09SUM1_03040 [soil metagenome]